MPFQPGNIENTKRKVRRGGAIPPQQKEIKKAAQEIAREFIEENVKPVLENYFKLAKGYYETRVTAMGQEYEVFVPDGPTTRHFVDKILPEAKPAVVFNIKNVEEFNWNEYQAVCIAPSSPRVIEAAANSDGIDESVHPAYSDSQASLISKFTPS